VVNVSVLVVLLVVLADLSLSGGLSLLFDVTFVLVCVAAALAVRPRDFFVVGVFPPLLMAGTVALVATASREVVAKPDDGFLQAVVSGLAHHSGSLVIGYGLTLGILALRQVALRRGGAIRQPRLTRTQPSQTQPSQTQPSRTQATRTQATRAGAGR
jgi:hypothetical protein